MCDRWVESFDAFVQDMGKRPEGCTIDRIDVNGMYCPENCRWATKLEQDNNRRRTVKVRVGSEDISFTQACRKFGLPYWTVYYRVRSKQKTYQEAIDDALSQKASEG